MVGKCSGVFSSGFVNRKRPMFERTQMRFSHFEPKKPLVKSSRLDEW
jgi:hypothetical protein